MYEDIAALVEAWQGDTDGNTVFESIGSELFKSSHWNIMVMHIHQHMKGYMTHHPTIQASHKLLDCMDREPSQENKNQLSAIVEQIPTHCAAMGNDACPDLEILVTEVACAQAEFIVLAAKNADGAESGQIALFGNLP